MERFEELARANQMEVLKYRLIPKSSEPPVRAVTETLASFQKGFAVVLDAIESRNPKKRARLSEAATKASDFGFSYAFAGSIGFTLTLPRDTTLLTTKHDEAIQAVRQLGRVRSRADIQEFANQFGLASVRTLYAWLDCIAFYDIDNVLQWSTASDGQSMEFTMQVPDAKAIRDIIAGTSEITNSQERLTGTLLAYASDRKTFRFATAAGIIHGSVSERITDQLVVPSRYNITVNVEIKSLYSTEATEKSYKLIDILIPR